MSGMAYEFCEDEGQPVFFFDMSENADIQIEDLIGKVLQPIYFQNNLPLQPVSLKTYSSERVEGFLGSGGELIVQGNWATVVDQSMTVKAVFLEPLLSEPLCALHGLSRPTPTHGAMSGYYCMQLLR